MYLDHAANAVSPATPVAYINRRAERISFDMLVRYSWRGHRATALVKDLTRFGARIEGISGLRQGDWLTLLLPEVQPIDAEIAWVEGQSAGLSFESTVPAGPFDDLVSNFATTRSGPAGGTAFNRAA